jgi:hypothetical protein
MKKLSLVMLILLSFTSTSYSAIISGDFFTDAGNAVNLSGLEWLSFDDTNLGTLSISREAIEDPNSQWVQEGWRYAAVEEIEAMMSSLGISMTFSGSSSIKDDGVGFIFDNWGGITIQNYGDGIEDRSELTPNPFIRYWEEYLYVVGQFGDTFNISGYSQLYSEHLWFTSPQVSHLDFLEPSTRSDYTKTQPSFSQPGVVLTTNDNFIVASFLVKGENIYQSNANAITEPSALALFFLGFIGLFGINCRKA